MKKTGLIALVFLLTITALHAQQKTATDTVNSPKIKFEVTNYDFGKIKEQDGKASYTFKFKNTSTKPLVITRVQASCGCTTPEWTKEPISSGKTGVVTVTYNPVHRPGVFHKTITVYSNIAEGKTILSIKGEVIPQPTVLQN